MVILISALGMFALLLIILVTLRLKVNPNFEIKQSEILVGLIPVVLWLLLTGKIESLEFGDLKIQTAFIEASETEISEQVTELNLPVESLHLNEKGGSHIIPRLIQQHTEGLVFRIGYGFYYGPAIMQFLKRLNEFPFFKYIIVLDNSGDRFVGIIDSRTLHSLLVNRESNISAADFARWINRGEISRVRQLPGFISTDEAILPSSEKQLVLERMEKLNLEFLPVVNEETKLVGIVSRSRLTASLIIDVAKKVK